MSAKFPSGGSRTFFSSKSRKNEQGSLVLLSGGICVKSREKEDTYFSSGQKLILNYSQFLVFLWRKDNIPVMNRLCRIKRLLIKLQHKRDANCECGEKETINHYLIECAKYENVRGKILITMGYITWA